MGLESATYITDLVVTNPLGTDGKSQGDNHIRLIKQVLTNQFPNLGSAAVTGTAAQLNEAVAASTPEGGIIMWAGTTAQVPTGWQLCNGTGTTNNLAIPVPNLTSKFIVGSITDTGGTYDIGDTGGSADISGTSDSHTLTISQIPAHTHSFTAAQPIGGFTDNGGAPDERSVASASNTSSVGGGNGHTHGISLVGQNLPPYYALAFIMYLG